MIGYAIYSLVGVRATTLPTLVRPLCENSMHQCMCLIFPCMMYRQPHTYLLGEIKFAPGVEWLMIHDTCPYTLYMVPSLSTQQGEIHVKKIREYTNYAVENITRDIYVCYLSHSASNKKNKRYVCYSQLS